MDQDEPGRNSPQSGGQRPVSTVRSYSRLRSYTGHGKLTYSVNSDEPGQCDLVVNSSDTSVAGLYTCAEADGDKAKAHVTIIGQLFNVLFHCF